MTTLASSGWVLVQALLGQGCVLMCPLTSAICTLGQNLACCPRTTPEVGWWLTWKWCVCLCVSVGVGKYLRSGAVWQGGKAAASE